jgi:hypothetical protein
MGAMLSESSETWHVDLQGCKVLLINIGHHVTLVLHGEEAVEGGLVLQSPFELRMPGEAALALDPQDQAALGPVLRCFAKVVGSVVVSPKDSSLAVTFTDGTTISVPAQEGYEAWEVSVRADPSRSRHGVLITAGTDEREPAVFDSRDPVVTVDTSDILGPTDGEV